MNKKILLGTAFAMAASSAVFAQTFATWYGDEGYYQITTGLDNGTKTAGYWYSYNDKNDGGASDVNWNGISLDNGYSTDALDNVIDHCGGVCGTAELNSGTLTYKPFVGIGFNVAGTETEDGGEAQQADASSWGGICIAYSSDIAPSLEMGLGDADDQALGYDNPAVELPKSRTGSIQSVVWSDFRQAGWGKGKIEGPAAAAKLASIKFKLQAVDGNYNFNIMSIGPASGNCRLTNAEGADAIKGVRGVEAAKAIVSAGKLSFSGIKSTASVEIINLQGQVMMKSSINASSVLDLSTFDAGIYMVRVTGKAVDFASKIVLK